MTDAPAIYEALVRIQSELGRIEKDGRGPSSQGAYPFMKVDTIVARLNPLLVEHGVVVIGTQSDADQQVFRFPKVNMDNQPVFDGRPDAFQVITRIRYEFTFVSAIDGSSVTAAAYGESADTGDKGIRRAATAAYKEVLLRVFTITSGEEDPDSLDPNEQPAQVSRQNRGAQARERAARGTKEKAERAPRPPRQAEPEQQPEQQPEEKAEPEPEQPEIEPEAPTEPEPEQQAPASSAKDRAAAARERAAAARRSREEATPAEQPAAEAEPDPEPSPDQTPPARVPSSPVSKPQPETQADERYESVNDIRAAIRTALAEKGLDRSFVNTVGDELTGKPRGQWFAMKSDLLKVLARIESIVIDADTGEIGYADDDGGF